MGIAYTCQTSSYFFSKDPQKPGRKTPAQVKCSRLIGCVLWAGLKSPGFATEKVGKHGIAIATMVVVTPLLLEQALEGKYSEIIYEFIDLLCFSHPKPAAQVLSQMDCVYRVNLRKSMWKKRTTFCLHYDCLCYQKCSVYVNTPTLRLPDTNQILFLHLKELRNDR